MDYIPVYADEQDDPGTVKVSLDKIQRIGVRTEKVEARPIVRTVRAVGTRRARRDARFDDRRVALRRLSSRISSSTRPASTSSKGEPLFRVYSPQIQLRQTDLIVAMRAEGTSGSSPNRAPRRRHATPAQSRRSAKPHRRGPQDRDQSANPRLAVARDGDVIEKKVINGQRVVAGDELYRIADHSRVWVIAEVAEADIAAIKVGMPATVTLRALTDRAASKAR